MRSFHVKKRNTGKAVELPNQLELRNYRLRNTSTLKLWSVEDQRLDRDPGLSKPPKPSKSPAKGDLQLAPVESKEMEVNELERKPCKQTVNTSKPPAGRPWLDKLNPFSRTAGAPETGRRRS